MSAQRILNGRCLCGGIRYSIAGPFVGVLNCHCSMCRKAHGAAFRTRAAVRTADFIWHAGRDLLTRYESSPGTFRTFCSVCGANIITQFTERPGWLGFALGTLDDDPGVRPAMHVMTDYKAPWHEITDDLPTFGELPPE